MKKIEKVFKAFGDKNRLRILKLLEKKTMCVCELAYVLGIRQPSVSRHLKKLKAAGVIGSAREGFWTVYHLERSNQYVDTLLHNIRTWMNDDQTVRKDRQKAQRANRQKLCCKT